MPVLCAVGSWLVPPGTAWAEGVESAESVERVSAAAVVTIAYPNALPYKTTMVSLGEENCYFTHGGDEIVEVYRVMLDADRAASLRRLAVLLLTGEPGSATPIEAPFLRVAAAGRSRYFPASPADTQVPVVQEIIAIVGSLGVD